jgi:hypothetical protein
MKPSHWRRLMQADPSLRMFLYAYVILESLKFLDTVDQVRRDLKILPTDLHNAYATTFLLEALIDNKF